MKLKIALLGSTGSIGRQVVNCVNRYPERFEIISLAACSNAALLSEQIKTLHPKIAALADERYAKDVVVESGTKFYSGRSATLEAVTEEADLVFVAIMGFAGLESVIKAINLKKNVALANKETLVAGGEIVTALAKEKGVELIPVDSEHSAIWQSMYLDKKTPFKRLLITASGGAFRDVPLEELGNMKARDALKHPNWVMGKKITIDCATMVNKGLEVIEAKWLFDCPYDKIGVLYHPESIVHSLVEYPDGALIAQLGYPSMELPISLALSYPERLEGAPTLDLVGKTLHFDQVSLKRYPCFKVILEGAKAGGNIPCALSAANEEIVKLYLNDEITFSEIYDYLAYVLDKTPKRRVDYEELVRTDGEARKLVLDRFPRR